ncbi:hypothetical protein NOCARDAX2BIS_180043 [Nocardioides sp. AX2bis]|nr:hypothetical protein NOCARDAX2BIS_180043 [Nocardioides sp. AX2bis]
MDPDRPDRGPGLLRASRRRPRLDRGPRRPRPGRGRRRLAPAPPLTLPDPACLTLPARPCLPAHPRSSPLHPTKEWPCPPSTDTSRPTTSPPRCARTYDAG